MVDEADPQTAHKRDGGYFTSDQDDDGEDSDVMALDQDVTKASVSSKKNRSRQRQNGKHARSVGNGANDPHVISSDDDIEIVEQPEAGPSKSRSSVNGYKESQLAFDHDEEEEVERVRMEYLEETRNQHRSTENSAPVYTFDDRITERDREILAPQQANPVGTGARSAKRVKSNDKRAYWEAKSGRSMHQNDNVELDYGASSNRDSSSTRKATRGPAFESGLPYEGAQESDAAFASNWRQKAQEAKELSRAGKDDIANNSDFISFEDL